MSGRGDGPVAGVILLRGAAALLQLRDDKPGLRHSGRWVPPGGHCHAGESREDCARREMFEETGYRCDSLKWLIAILDDQAGWPPYELTIYWARYDGAQPIRCHEGQAFRFVERGEADSLEVPRYLVEIWDRAIAAASGPAGDSGGGGEA